MSIQTTLQRYPASSKFFLLLGLFLFSLVVASAIQVAILIPFANVKNLQDLANLDELSSPDLVKGMKIAQAVSVLVTFILPALLFAYFSSEKKISYLKMNRGFSPALGITVILLVLAIMPFINWLGEVNSHLTLPGFLSGLENWMKESEQRLKKLTEAFLQMDTLGDLIVNIVVIALLAAIGEELFFRGCMQNIFLEWSGSIHAAVWTTAILFSALHMQFFGFLPRMVLGVVLGYLYICSGSLWLSMLFHFLNNGFAVVIAYLIGQKTLEEGADTIGAGTTPLYYVLVSVIISIGLMQFIYRNREEVDLNPLPPSPKTGEGGAP